MQQQRHWDIQRGVSHMHDTKVVPNTRLTAGKIPPGTQPRLQHCTLMPLESSCTPRWWQKEWEVTARRDWSTAHVYGTVTHWKCRQIKSFATRETIYCVPPLSNSKKLGEISVWILQQWMLKPTWRVEGTVLVSWQVHKVALKSLLFSDCLGTTGNSSCSQNQSSPSRFSAQ